jgi:2-oxoglutarate ferredoxin oxidoreductase subunit alpha
MRFNILIGGKAGQGVNELANILARAFGKEGFYVFNYRDYQSLITGGHNFNVICISDEKTGSFDKEYDAVLALDQETLDVHKNDFSKKAFFIVNFPIKKKNFIALNVRNDKTANMAFAAALFKVLGLRLDNLVDVVKERFKGRSLLEHDIHELKEFYSKDFKMHVKLEHDTTGKIVMSGSEGIAKGAVMSGIDVYFAYPMTPSTGVLNMLAKEQDKKFFAFTPEDEIAVANGAIGASFAGAKAMVGTSGGGFDLMTEALGLQGMVELPLVVYLASRGSNSTGLPTYTGQQDLMAALYGGHGEFPRVVTAPGCAKEAIEKTNEAFYLADKFGALSILLADKHLAESDFSCDNLNIKSLVIPARKEKPGESIFKRTSYEHDKDWNNAEDAKNAVVSTEKRIARELELEKEAKKFEMFKLFGKGKNLVISWGSTKGAILDAIRDLDAKFLQILYLSPFPKEIKKLIEEHKNVFVIEQSATCQLSNLISQHTGYVISDKNKILKFDGRPFIPDEIIHALKERGVK